MTAQTERIKPKGCKVVPLDKLGLNTKLANWFAKQAETIGESAWFLAHADDGVIWGQIRSGKLALSGTVYPNVSPSLEIETVQQARLFAEKAELRLWRDEQGFSACRLEDVEDEDSEAFDEYHILWGTKKVKPQKTNQEEEKPQKANQHKKKHAKNKHKKRISKKNKHKKGNRKKDNRKSPPQNRAQDKTAPPQTGFTLVEDGRQGLRHAVPIEVPDRAFSPSGSRRRKRPLRLQVRHYIKYDKDGHAYTALSRLVALHPKLEGEVHESETSKS